MTAAHWRYANNIQPEQQALFKPLTAGTWAWYRAKNAFADYLPISECSFWDQPFFFLSIPKNATTTISHFLAPDHYLGHVYAEQYPERVWPRLKTVVRNPYDRLVSAYHFMIRGGFFKNPEYAEIADAYLDFEDWVLRGLSEELCARLTQFEVNGWRDPILPQSIWLTNAEGELLIARENIARFENLVPDVRRVFGFEIQERRNASTGRQSWQAYYTNLAVGKKVAALYAKDFALFGYETEFL